MKTFLLLMLLVVSVKSFAEEFRSFEEYKKNNAVLANDIERLEALEKVKHDQFYSDLLGQYRLLFSNYEQINSPLTLEAFIKDASESGWKATTARANSLLSICEGNAIDRSKCLEGLGKLKIFVNSSNLGETSKESIVSFIDNYTQESIQLAVFDQEFISRFNSNTKILNDVINPAKKSPAMTFKITPVKKESHLAAVPAVSFKVKTIERITSSVAGAIQKNYPDFLFFFGSLLVFITSLVYYKRRSRFRALKQFCGKATQIARKNKMKVKFFGFIDFSGVSILKKIELPFLESFKNLDSFAEEVHVKFKAQKNVLKLESRFFCNQSIMGAVKKESSELKKSLDNLQNIVLASGGEIVYCNNFNTNGEIIDSNIIISLPLR